MDVNLKYVRAVTPVCLCLFYFCCSSSKARVYGSEVFSFDSVSHSSIPVNALEVASASVWPCKHRRYSDFLPLSDLLRSIYRARWKKELTCLNSLIVWDTGYAKLLALSVCWCRHSGHSGIGNLFMFHAVSSKRHPKQTCVFIQTWSQNVKDLSN